jgi:predicted PurR-regulated permease PerM
MNALPISRYDWFSWTLFTVVLLLVLHLHLLPALIAGLFVYALVNVMVPVLRVSSFGRAGTRMLAVTLIAVVVIALLIVVGFGIGSFVRHSGENLPALIQRMAEIIESSRDQLPVWLRQYIPTDAEELRLALVGWLRAHAEIFQVAGTGLGRALAHVLIGMVIGALLALETAVPREALGPLAAAMRERSLRLASAFQNVVFAQIWISAINAIFTGLYLVVLLPSLGYELPFTKTLVLITFVAGLIPILGNLISNSVIFVVSFSQSVYVAFGSLAYLVIIHKLEYFLNARIVGGHIRARAWELLVAMLVMEAAFGIAGLVAAPIYYAYVKDELREKRLI